MNNNEFDAIVTECIASVIEKLGQDLFKSPESYSVAPAVVAELETNVEALAKRMMNRAAQFARFRTRSDSPSQLTASDVELAWKSLLFDASQ